MTMVSSQLFGLKGLFLEILDSEHRGRCARDGRKARDSAHHGLRPDFHQVSSRSLSSRGVDDKVDLAILDEVHHIGSSLGNLVYALDIKSVMAENPCCSLGRNE